MAQDKSTVGQFPMFSLNVFAARGFSGLERNLGDNKGLIGSGDTSRLLGLSIFLELRDILGCGLGWPLCRFLDWALDGAP